METGRKMKPCPFCGSDAEVALWTSAQLHKTCATREEALIQLEKYRCKGFVLEHSVYPVELRRKHRIDCTVERYPKFRLSVTLQKYVPRCTNKSCVARSATTFYSEQMAIDAWNDRRRNHV